VRVDHHARTTLYEPWQRFARQVRPAYHHNILPWQPGVANVNPTSVGAQNILMDPDLQAVYPRPVFVPHHQTDEPYGSDPNLPLPVLTWTPDAVTSTFPSSTLNKPYGFRELCFQQTGSNYNSGLYYMGIWEGACQGFTFFWSRYDQQDAKVSTWPLNQRFQTFRVGVGTGVDRVVYSVRFGLGDALISRSISWDPGRSVGDEAEGWVELSRVPIAADWWTSGYGEGERDLNPYEPGYGVEPGMDYTAPKSPDRYNVISFTLLAGRMCIRVGGLNHVCYYDEMRIDADENPLWQINYAAMRAQGFSSLRFSGHPTKWFMGSDPSAGEGDPSFLTAPESIGFYNPNHSIDIEYAGIVPPDTSVQAGALTDVSGPEAQVEAIFRAPIAGRYKLIDYADFTCALRAITVVYTGQKSYGGGASWEPQPEQVTVRHTFNPMALQVTSAAQAVFNNQRAVTIPNSIIPDHLGRYWLRTGQRALEVRMARTLALTGAISGPELVFTGYGGTQVGMQGEAGSSFVTLSAADRRLQLQSPRWGLPWMDGWNHFYAIGYLASLGGVAQDDLAFAMPPGRFDNSHGPDGEPAYFLPIGPGGSVITRRSGQPLWSIMTDIAYSVGYMLFFDVRGRLQYRKWRMPAGVKRTFHESDWQSGGLEGCWQLRVDKDMSKVRSDLIIIGVNAFSPTWDPIVYAQRDQAVIDDPNVYNHLGYPNPAVWIDSQFAQASYAEEASVEMYKDLRNPDLSVGLTTWLQPDIFPLDVISVSSYRHGTTGLRFLVMDVVHQVSIATASTTLTGTFYVPTS